MTSQWSNICCSTSYPGPATPGLTFPHGPLGRSKGTAVSCFQEEEGSVRRYPPLAGVQCGLTAVSRVRLHTAEAFALKMAGFSLRQGMPSSPALHRRPPVPSSPTGMPSSERAPGSGSSQVDTVRRGVAVLSGESRVSRREGADATGLLDLPTRQRMPARSSGREETPGVHWDSHLGRRLQDPAERQLGQWRSGAACRRESVS